MTNGIQKDFRDQIHIEEIKTWEQEINKKINKYKCI